MSTWCPKAHFPIINWAAFVRSRQSIQFVLTIPFWRRYILRFWGFPSLKPKRILLKIILKKYVFSVYTYFSSRFKTFIHASGPLWKNPVSAKYSSAKFSIKSTTSSSLWIKMNQWMILIIKINIKNIYTVYIILASFWLSTYPMQFLPDKCLKYIDLNKP